MILEDQFDRRRAAEDAHKRILVLDDEDGIREAMSSLLSQAGYQVCTSHDGQDALEHLRRNPVDLVIFDLRMPVMDGWQFRTIQRAEPGLAEIPVIAMSADGSAKAAAIHADLYLRKPFDPDALLLAIEKVLVARDRQKLAQQLRDAERTALLGTIATGVGHEINNPLTYVLASLDLIDGEIASLEDAPAPPGWRNRLGALQANLRDVRLGAERIRDVVGSLRWLSRSRRETHRTVDLAQVLETSIAIASNEIRHRARLARHFDDLPSIRGDEARLGQVFVNLLVNAAQAIPMGAIDSNQISVAGHVQGGHAVVEVRDSGVGIAFDLHGKIFEPFFTTKDAVTGTGLGLAISQNIVHEHGGRIELESAPGRGSLFRVLLPIDHERGTDDRPPAFVAAQKTSPAIRVLVIDDDPLVLSAIERMLSEDHLVVALGSAREAIAHLAGDRELDAILCDLMMPDMTGMDFHGELSRLDGALASRVVFMTGGAFAPEARDFLRRVRTTCLDKPFTRDELYAALSAAASLKLAAGAERGPS